MDRSSPGFILNVWVINVMISPSNCPEYSANSEKNANGRVFKKTPWNIKKGVFVFYPVFIPGFSRHRRLSQDYSPTLLVLQSRFGDKPLRFQVVCTCDGVYLCVGTVDQVSCKTLGDEIPHTLGTKFRAGFLQGMRGICTTNFFGLENIPSSISLAVNASPGVLLSFPAVEERAALKMVRGFVCYHLVSRVCTMWYRVFGVAVA